MIRRQTQELKFTQEELVNKLNEKYITSVNGTYIRVYIDKEKSNYVIVDVQNYSVNVSYGRILKRIKTICTKIDEEVRSLRTKQVNSTYEQTQKEVLNTVLKLQGIDTTSYNVYMYHRSVTTSASLSLSGVFKDKGFTYGDKLVLSLTKGELRTSLHLEKFNLELCQFVDSLITKIEDNVMVAQI